MALLYYNTNTYILLKVYIGQANEYPTLVYVSPNISVCVISFYALNYYKPDNNASLV